MQAFLLVTACLVPSAGETDPEVRKLQTALVKTLKSAQDDVRKHIKQGLVTESALLRLAKPLRDAELAVATTDAERIAAHEAYFKLVLGEDERALAKYEAGAIPLNHFVETRAQRIQAEIDLRKAGGKPPRGTKAPADPKHPADLDAPAPPKKG